MNIFESNYADVYYIKDQQLGKIIWKEKCSSEEYQAAFQKLIDLQKTETISRFISDIRKQSVISPLDRKWFENIAFPKAVEQGLKVAAVIFDGSVFKKYYMNVIIGATNKFGIPLRLFNSMDDAENFVFNVNSTDISSAI